MTDLKFHSERITLSGPGGSTVTTDVTGPTGFGTVKAAVVFVTGTNAANNPEDGLNTCIGFWDGTSQRCNTLHAQDAVSSGSPDYHLTRSDVGAVACGAAGTVIAEYAISAITNGIRFTATGSSSWDRYATVLLISGDDVTAKVGTFDIPRASATVGDTASITDPGFKPDVVFFRMVGGGTAAEADGTVYNTDDTEISWGCAVDDAGTVKQRCSAGGLYKPTTAVDSVYYDDCAVAKYGSNGSAVLHKTAVTAFTDSGFNVTSVGGSSGYYEEIVNYLALDLGHARYQLDDITTRTSTGTTEVTTNFTPKALVSAASGCSTEGTAVAHIFDSYGTADSVTGTAGTCQCYNAQDNVATTNTFATSGGVTLINQRSPTTKSALIAAAVSAWGTSSYTLNYTTVNATGRLGWTLALTDQATSEYTAAASTTWTATSETVDAEVWGGGGGGYNDASTAIGGGGGGGGGGYAKKQITGLTIGTDYDVVVGAGGATDASGGQSYFQGATVVRAAGGSAGTGAGGAGGAGTHGDTLYTGGAGGGTNATGGGGGGSSAGTGSNGNAGSADAAGTGGAGGAAVTGGGAGGKGDDEGTDNGVAGSAPGGGGGAGSYEPGSAGAAGQVIITPIDTPATGNPWYYYAQQ